MEKEARNLIQFLFFFLFFLDNLTSLFNNSLPLFLLVLEGQLYSLLPTACLLEKIYDKNYKDCSVVRQEFITNLVNQGIRNYQSFLQGNLLITL